MRSSPLIALILLVAGLAGCARENDVDDGTGPATARESRSMEHPGVDPPPPPPSPSPDPLFDATAFAGDFRGDGVLLQLRTDGRYHLRAAAGTPQAGLRSEGLWSLETGSGHLLLVPHAADEPRRRYSMPAADELIPEGGDPPLHRVGTDAG